MYIIYRRISELHQSIGAALNLSATSKDWNNAINKRLRKEYNEKLGGPECSNFLMLRDLIHHDTEKKKEELLEWGLKNGHSKLIKARIHLATIFDSNRSQRAISLVIKSKMWRTKKILDKLFEKGCFVEGTHIIEAIRCGNNELLPLLFEKRPNEKISLSDDCSVSLGRFDSSLLNDILRILAVSDTLMNRICETLAIRNEFDIISKLIKDGIVSGVNFRDWAPDSWISTLVLHPASEVKEVLKHCYPLKKGYRTFVNMMVSISYAKCGRFEDLKSLLPNYSDRLTTNPAFIKLEKSLWESIFYYGKKFINLFVQKGFLNTPFAQSIDRRSLNTKISSKIWEKFKAELNESSKKIAKRKREREEAEILRG